MTSSAESRLQVEAAIKQILQNMTFVAPVMGQSTWVTVDDRLRLWGDVPADQQPYTCLVTHRARNQYTGLGLVRRRMEYSIWCYSRTDDPASRGIIDLGNLMDSLELAFAPDNPSINQLTLKGLVYWCRIEGQTLEDPGDIDNQALLLVPLIVEMP